MQHSLQVAFKLERSSDKSSDEYHRRENSVLRFRVSEHEPPLNLCLKSPNCDLRNSQVTCQKHTNWDSQCATHCSPWMSVFFFKKKTLQLVRLKNLDFRKFLMNQNFAQNCFAGTESPGDFEEKETHFIKMQPFFWFVLQTLQQHTSHKESPNRVVEHFGTGCLLNTVQYALRILSILRKYEFGA